MLTSGQRKMVRTPFPSESFIQKNFLSPTVSAQASESSTNGYDFDLFTLGGGTAGVRASRLSAGLGDPPPLPSLPTT